jgi:hypothetical protein
MAKSQTTTAKKSTTKSAAKKTPVGAKAAAEKLAAAPAPAKPKAKAAPAPVDAAPEQTVATPELQQLANERFEIVGRLSAKKGEINKIEEELKSKNQELVEAGAVPGMLFENEDGDPMQFTHNWRSSTSHAKVLKAFAEKHPEFAEELAELSAEFTSENQQQPGFKAA